MKDTCSQSEVVYLINIEEEGMPGQGGNRDFEREEGETAAWKKCRRNS